MQRPTRKIPFSPPDISEAEIQEVTETLRSGWITTGPRTKQLEREQLSAGYHRKENLPAGLVQKSASV